MIEHIKQSFLQVTKVTSPEQAMSNSLIAALQHNPTYQPNATGANKEEFRNRFAQQIGLVAKHDYEEKEQEYLKTIVALSDDLSHQFAGILLNGRLRIGTTQKALNLYLKFIWCLDQNFKTPLHCPVDRIVLQAVNINDAWTKLDSIELYSAWISAIRSAAERSGAANIAEWELGLWNQAVTAK